MELPQRYPGAKVASGEVVDYTTCAYFGIKLFSSWTGNRLPRQRFLMILALAATVYTLHCTILSRDYHFLVYRCG